jgi:hypothetical protein
VEYKLSHFECLPIIELHKKTSKKWQSSVIFQKYISLKVVAVYFLLLIIKEIFHLRTLSFCKYEKTI